MMKYDKTGPGATPNWLGKANVTRCVDQGWAYSHHQVPGGSYQGIVVRYWASVVIFNLKTLRCWLFWDIYNHSWGRYQKVILIFVCFSIIFKKYDTSIQIAQLIMEIWKFRSGWSNRPSPNNLRNIRLDTKQRNWSKKSEIQSHK